MRKLIVVFAFLFAANAFAQTAQDSAKVYKKRVLEHVEIDILASYYAQDGQNAAVTGGIGTEELTDLASSITISIPLSADNVLTIDGSISAYTSASSGNLNPFPGSDDDDVNPIAGNGSPWVASSGASKQDLWKSGVLSYSHSSDDRNKIWGVNLSYANEYDYSSIGYGGSYTRLFNKKNTELGIKANVYLDSWDPEYPTELSEYIENGGLGASFFSTVDVLDQTANVIDKNGPDAWRPFKSTLIESKSRNTYSLSLSFSQILSKKAQISIFSDIVQQQGWLANPMQRVYFADKDNFYIGNASSIGNYTSPNNTDIFQLADDIERLPNTRLKIPIGVRFNYYINEVISLRTYYRYYFDDWGVNSHTANIELPTKIAGKFTLYPSYRFYQQTAADYFAPFETHLSTQAFYTSDYDLSQFNSSQYSLGFKYTDILTKLHIGSVRLKNLSLDYSYYQRNTGLTAFIATFGAKFVIDK